MVNLFKENYVCQFCFKIHKNKSDYILNDIIPINHKKKKNSFSCCKKCYKIPKKEEKINHHLNIINEKTKFYILLLTIFLIADVFTTWYLLTNVSTATEMNPFMNNLFIYFDSLIIPLLLTHLFAFGFLLFSKYRVYKINRVIDIIMLKKFLFIMIILYIFVIVSNSIQVFLSLFGII